MSRPVPVHKAALVDSEGFPTSTFCTLPNGTEIELTRRDDVLDVDFKCSVVVKFKLLDPRSIGIGLFDKFQRLLMTYAIPGDPTKHKRGDLVTLAPRFTIIQTIARNE